MMLKSGVEYFILKSSQPLQSCCCPVQRNLPRKAELTWQVSRYLWRGSMNFNNYNFKTRDFSSLIKWVLVGVWKAYTYIDIWKVENQEVNVTILFINSQNIVLRIRIINTLSFNENCIHERGLKFICRSRALNSSFFWNWCNANPD